MNMHICCIFAGLFFLSYICVFILIVCLFTVFTNLCESDYMRPSPVQMQAIPAALSGRDLLVCANTGSGKSELYAPKCHITLTHTLTYNTYLHTFSISAPTYTHMIVLCTQFWYILTHPKNKIRTYSLKDLIKSY